MSDQSWKDEFYPTEASDCPVDRAVAHSLQKWKGYRKGNLEKHGIATPPEAPGTTTCALCQRYIGSLCCFGCPLLVDGVKRCFACPPGKEIDPYGAYVEDGNPEPMIALLESVMPQPAPVDPLLARGALAQTILEGILDRPNVRAAVLIAIVRVLKDYVND